MTAFIFDIDGTIIDSMRFHERSWDVFLTRRGVPTVGEDFFRKTAGRTGVEVMRELFGPLSDADANAYVREKERIYRELFGPQFGRSRASRRSRGTRRRPTCASPARRPAILTTSRSRSAGSKWNRSSMPRSVRTTWPAASRSPISSCWQRGASARLRRSAWSSRTRRSGSKAARRAGMRAVAIASTVPADELGVGAHVIARARDFTTLDARALAAHLLA
jgi:hypothetical protein